MDEDTIDIDVNPTYQGSLRLRSGAIVHVTATDGQIVIDIRSAGGENSSLPATADEAGEIAVMLRQAERVC